MLWFNKLVHLSFIILGSILTILGLSFAIALLTDAEEMLTIALILLLFVPYFVAILANGSMAINPGDPEYVAFDIQSPYSNRLQTSAHYRVKSVFHNYSVIEYLFSYGWWLDNLKRLYRRCRLAKSPLVRVYALFPSIIFTYFTNEINQYYQENELSHLIPDNYFWRNLKLFNYLFTIAQFTLPIVFLLLLIYPNIYLEHETSAIFIIVLLQCIYGDIMKELVDFTRKINRVTFSEN